MSESPKSTPEAEKSTDIKSNKPEPKSPEQLRQETLNSLGGEFNVGWDAFFTQADFSGLRSKFLNKDKTFNQEAFFEAINKLHPEYLEHIQKLFQKEKKAEEQTKNKDKRPKTPTEQQEENQEMLAKLTKLFINRVEFFSRLKSPETITAGGKTREQLINEMRQNNINISDTALQMMENEAFTTTKEPEKVKFVRLIIKDLFDDSKKHIIDEIYAKAEKEEGLALCESQDGPNYRLHYTKQPPGEYLRMGMKQISDLDGNLGVFDLDHVGDGVWLFDGWAGPDDHWSPGSEVVFRFSVSRK